MNRQWRHAVALAMAVFVLAALTGVPSGFAVAPRGGSPLGANPLFLPMIARSGGTLPPKTPTPKPTYVPVVDIQDRAASAKLFHDVYLASVNVPMGWSGNTGACDAGDTSPQYKEAVRRRVYYFRAMAGVPVDISLSADYNRMAQQAALMMSRNNNLSHEPPATWACYTAAGATAAANSNLALGNAGPDAVSDLMDDVSRICVGHRRWILCPPTRVIGTGDVLGSADQRFLPANALWIMDLAHYRDPRPPTRNEFVAWPPPGFVPRPVAFRRWSFSYGGADFSRATVHMTSKGASVTLSQERLVPGSCDNTLVWVPDIDWLALDVQGQDQTFTVEVRNVSIAGATRSFRYTVTIFQPLPSGIQPAAMVHIPAGPFQMGCNRSNDPDGCPSSDELPLHTVYLDAYRIDKYEVTNARYAACVKAGACTAPHSAGSDKRTAYYGNATYANYPVIHVDWTQAAAFCAWEGKRLPTEAEWEKAGRGAIDTRVYPWGDAAPTCDFLNAVASTQPQGCVGDTKPVGSYPVGASPYGVMDLSGNVAEWVSDLYESDYYSRSPARNPTGPSQTLWDRHVQRGGDWSSPWNLTVAARTMPITGYDAYTGFRCARSE